jgi:hypothetical protein
MDNANANRGMTNCSSILEITCTLKSIKINFASFQNFSKMTDNTYLRLIEKK